MSKTKTIFILLFDTVISSVIVFSFLYHSILQYGLSQAKGQLQIVFNTREISEVITDASVHDSIKNKLRLIAEIKKYAIDSLGIKVNDNYTTYYDQKGKALMWVVTAAEPYRMKAYEWEFPILGNFSYKGYFNKEKALLEKNRLKSMGYDTDLGTASGWSTLGWLRDPVLSGMLKRSEGQLANLIIHEMTHGTLYVKDNVDFNENLANFIGHQGALRFLKQKFGENSIQLKRYREQQEDEKIFVKYVLSGAKKLEEFYRESVIESDLRIRERDKKKHIQKIMDGLSGLPLNNKKRYEQIIKDAYVSGNAFFMGYYRYDVKGDDFEKELDVVFRGNIRAYIQSLQKKYTSL